MRFLLLLTLFAQMAFAQSKIRLIDSQSRLGIAYANIWCDGKLLVSTDSTGTANLASDCSRLTVSATGFKTKTIDAAQAIIFLEADTLQIRDVEVRRPRLKKSLTLGKLKSGDIGIVVRRENSVGSVGKYFAPVGDYFLKEFQFKAHRSANRMVTISVYSVDENQKPDELLVQSDIVKHLPKGNGICKVDLTPYRLAMPEGGVFISVNFVLIDRNKHFSERNPEWFFYEPSLNATRTEGFENTWHLDETGWKKSENYRVDFALKLTD